MPGLNVSTCAVVQAGAGGAPPAASLHGPGQPGRAPALHLRPAVLLPSIQRPARPGELRLPPSGCHPHSMYA